MIPFLIVTLILYMVIKFSYKLSFKNTKSRFIGSKELELTDKKVSFKTDFSETIYEWSAFIYNRETKNCYYLYIEKNQALVIPKTAFKCEKQKTEFKALIKAKKIFAL